jgi:uncharacterized protein YcbK (DUF882 family)
MKTRGVMNRIGQLMGILGLLFGAVAPGYSQEPDQGRFFYSGDGQIHLVSEKNGVVFKGRFRTGPGRYDRQALETICRVFGAPHEPEMGLSLRLLDFIDYLEDTFRPGARVTIVSGYRDPEYNTMLNRKGSLAARASLHQYGMAADLRIEGVPSRRIWEYVRGLKFGGAGYYQGASVHVDVGPARFWDQTSSGVGTGISDDNKLIRLVTDYDRYLPGETIVMRFIRMTAFPIGVSPYFYLQHESKIAADGMYADEPVATLQPVFAVSADQACPQFGDIGQMAFIRAGLPAQLPAGRYVVRAAFCDNPWQEMPQEVVTPTFEVVDQGIPQ